MSSRAADYGIRSHSLVMRFAGLLAAPKEALLPVLRDPCQRWVGLGAEYDVAGTCRWLAKAYRVLGDEVSAAAELARAEETYERLGSEDRARNPRRTHATRVRGACAGGGRAF